MREWKECLLSKVAKFGNGKRKPKSEGDIPIFGGNGILGYSSESNYDGETIVIGRVGAYCGAVYYQNKPVWVSDNALAAKPKEGNNTKFLYYFLKNMDLNQFAGGSSHPLVTQTLLNSLEIKISNDEKEQKAIASVLSSLDDKIDLLHRQNKTLEAMAETLFRQWFVEEADEGWGEGDIYNLIEVVYGFPFKSKFFNDEKRGLPLIRIRDLKNGYSNIYTDEVCEEKHKIRCGDLLAGMDGEFRIYLWAGETSVLNQRACKFVPKFDFVPHLYVYGMMKPHLHYYENVKVGTTVIHLGKSDLDDIKISIPPKDVLIKFGEIVNPLFEKFKINYNQISTLEKMRDTLLPKLMSEKVRVGYER
jgi:type I restriction enzyme S subunit